MNPNPTAIASLAADLPALDWVTDPARVARLSQDFAWFSPVLKRQLADKTAEIAVRPRTEAEVAAVVGACARHGVPITVRGSGTGNYGQAIPLHGGLILDMSGYNGFGWARGGVGRAQAGIRLADFDRQARPQGWELRWLPSTFRSATLGGLFGGGFGGAGSITYGPVAAAGNVLGVRVMTVEPEPQVIELRSPEAMLMHHTYGTNGIVLELEVALAPALDWVESIAVFTAFDAALEFASALSGAPGLVKKEVCFLGAPVPDHMTALAEHLPTGCHAVLIVMAASSQDGMHELLAAAGGTLGYCKTAAESGSRTLLEYTWNHTTLVAMKVDRGLTYIQSAFDPVRHVEQVKTLEKALGGEVLMHLEFLRTKEGAVTCSGLQLIRYTTEERLNEIMQIHRDHGATINNPHVYILEDGKQGKLNPAAVELKRRFDPQGLLNPGKMRSWVTAEAGQPAEAVAAL
jgi:FAD/FMN-containing dehydrogenase